MLERATLERFADARTLGRSADRDFVGRTEIMAFVRRYALLIVVCVIVALVIGGLYLATATPRFSAELELIIDPKTAELLRRQTGEVDLTLDNAQVESQLAVLRSEKIAAAVIADLDLESDPEFQGRRASFGERLGFAMERWGLPDWIAALPSASSAAIAALRGPEPEPVTAFERSRQAIRAFHEHLTVRRVGLSYVISVSYRSVDPDKAAAITNAVGRAYIADQLDARTSAARQGSEWLEARIEELRIQADKAARAVYAFKAEHQLVDVGSIGLLFDQQLLEANRQVSSAREETARAEARLHRIDEILAGDLLDASVTDALGNTVINALRMRHVDAAARVEDFTTRYGDAHPSTLRARAEMTALETEMRDELSRIGAAYRSDREVARSREESLEGMLAGMSDTLAANRDAQVTLAELETVASTYRQMYESFLQQLTESVQRQTFPISNARIITAATRPLSPSEPRGKLILAFAAMAGATLGLGLAATRQILDRTVRSPKQIRDSLGTTCLGVVPKRNSWTRLTAKQGPRSPYVDAMRRVKTAIDIARTNAPMSVIGVTSLLPREGKTTLVADLAARMAMAGTPTLVVDGDLIGATLTRRVVGRCDTGWPDALSEGTDAKGLVRIGAAGGADLLPAPVGRSQYNGNDVLASERFRKLLLPLQSRYGLILIDLPSLTRAPDARALGPAVDGMLVVAEWGRAPVEQLADALEAFDHQHLPVIGVVVTKAERLVLSRKLRPGASV